MKYRKIWAGAGLAGSMLGLIAPTSISAQVFEEEVAESGPLGGAQDEIDSLRAQVEELSAREEAARQRVEMLEERLSRLERLDAMRIEPNDAATIRGRYVESRARAVPSDPAFAGLMQDDGGASEPVSGTASEEQVAAAEEDRKAPAPNEAVEEIAEQQQGRFGSRLGFEVGMGYTHFDSARINLDGFLALDTIFLGTISIDEVTADIFSIEPRLTYGVSDRLFMDVGIPYLFRTSNFRSGGAGGSASALIEDTVRDSGIGDLNVGASFRLKRETANWPDIVIAVRGKFPTGRHPFGVEFNEVENSEGNLQVPASLSTGTGVYGVSAGVSLLKTLDPMVIFGSATYFHNFARDFADIDENPGDQPGRVNVGSALQFGAGLAYALNDKSSISMSYTQRIVERTSLTPMGQDERDVVGSQANVALVNLGATFTLGPRVSLVANVGMGLTDDSPDMSLSIRLPIRF